MGSPLFLFASVLEVSTHYQPQRINNEYEGQYDAAASRAATCRPWCSARRLVMEVVLHITDRVDDRLLETVRGNGLGSATGVPDGDGNPCRGFHRDVRDLRGVVADGELEIAPGGLDANFGRVHPICIELPAEEDTLYLGRDPDPGRGVDHNSDRVWSGCCLRALRPGNLDGDVVLLWQGDVLDASHVLRHGRRVGVVELGRFDAAEQVEEQGDQHETRHQALHLNSPVAGLLPSALDETCFLTAIFAIKKQITSNV